MRTKLMALLIGIAGALALAPGQALAATSDSYSESNANSYLEVYTGSCYAGVGQAWTAENTGSVTSAKFYLEKVGSPTGYVTAQIYAYTNTYGSTAIPTGSALATSDGVDVSTVASGSPTLKTFTFSTPYAVTATNKYFITVMYSGGSSSNKLRVHWDTTSPTHSGNAARLCDGDWLAESAKDAIFYVTDNYTAPTPTPSPTASPTPTPVPATDTPSGALADFMEIFYAVCIAFAALIPTFLVITWVIRLISRLMIGGEK